LHLLTIIILEFVECLSLLSAVIVRYSECPRFQV